MAKNHLVCVYIVCLIIDMKWGGRTQAQRLMHDVMTGIVPHTLQMLTASLNKAT